MVAKYYGRNLNIEQLRQFSEIGKNGVSLLGLSDAAEKIGFRTIGIQATLRQLEEAILPAILHWSQYHFVVLYKVKRCKFYIADPAAGTFVLNKKQFEHRWLSSTIKVSRSPSDIEAFDPNNDNSAEKLYSSSNRPPESRAAVGIALLLEPNPAFYDKDYNRRHHLAKGQGF